MPFTMATVKRRYEKKMSRFSKHSLCAMAALAAVAASPAAAKEWQVAMVNRSPEGAMSFYPAYVKIAPGDSVRFVARDKSHNAESIAKLTPAGAALFKGKLNQDVVVRFVKPGLYGYKCLPHLGMGMVGLVQVGSAVNAAPFRAGLASLPPLARNRLIADLKRVR